MEEIPETPAPIQESQEAKINSNWRVYENVDEVVGEVQIVFQEASSGDFNCSSNRGGRGTVHCHMARRILVHE